MTFLIILWITEILCSFRLVLEGKTGKEIPQSPRLESLEKFSVNNFALPDAEDNISCLLNRGGIADLPLWRMLLAICKSKESSFWAPLFYYHVQAWQLQECFAMIASLPELYFRLRWFILLEQMKIVISMKFGSSTSSWKSWRWMTLHSIFILRDIYFSSNLNSLTKSTSSSGSTELKDILPWDLSQMIMKTIPISTRVVVSYMMKWGHPALSLSKSQWKLRQPHDQNFPVERKPL